VFDLGDAGDAHLERRGQVFLRQAELLAGLGKLVPPVLGKQPARPAWISSAVTPAARSSSSKRPSPAGSASASSFLFVSGVVDVGQFGYRDVVAVPACPVARLVAA